MGRPKKIKPQDKATNTNLEENEDEGKLTPQSHMKMFLDSNKKDHFNNLVRTEYKISTGSLKFDMLTDGGLAPGIIRFHGENSGGKTSEILELIRNAVAVRPRLRGLFIDAEARLTPEHRKRSGVKFVDKPEDWAEGTCFVYKTIIYESVIAMILSLIQNNPDKHEYFMALDSIDALILRDDLEKKPEEAYKVAGPAVLSKKLMQRITHPIHGAGHFFAFTSQITASVPKQGDKAPPPRVTGPNNLKHYCDWIFEILPRYQKHLILKNPKIEKYDEEKNPIIGHEVPMVIRKSPNEKNEVRFSYPIAYGRKDGNSIWVEREIGDTMVAYGFLQIKGSWLNFQDDFLEELRKIDDAAPQKIQGIENVYTYLIKNPKVKDFCFAKLKETLGSQKLWEGEGDPFSEEETDDAKKVSE